MAFQNRWLSVSLDDVKLPNGLRYEYTRLSIDSIGVGVIGFNTDGTEVLLEREYRHGVGEVIWQCPAGLIEAGEDLQHAALRELEEETGFAPKYVDANTVRYLGNIWDSPAFGRCCSHIFAVWTLEKRTAPNPDQAEFVTHHWKSVEWLKESVRNGEIRDRFVVSAVSYLLLNGLI